MCPKYSNFPLVNNNFIKNIKKEKSNKFKAISLENRLIKKPVYVYDNPIIDRDKIKKDIDEFSGIYLWYNTINGKCYIGSATNLYRRISNYYQNAFLKRPYPIMNAINKYGLHTFKLVILEILGKFNKVNPLLRLAREDYYLSRYLPEYNILEKASNSLNYKHSIEAKEKIRIKALMRDKSTIVYPKEFLNEQKVDKSGIRNPMYGKKWREKTKKLLCKPVYVYDSKTFNLLNYYSGTVLARKDLKIGFSTLSRHLKSKEPFKGKIFSKTPNIKKDENNN
jgi:group I intron endonuclease